MAQVLKTRPSRSFQSVDAVLDTIRGNVHRVEELTAVLDRQTQRSLIVAYLLLVLAGLLTLATLAVSSVVADAHADKLLIRSIVVFLIFFVSGFGFVFVSALSRRRLFIQQLQFAMMRLEEIAKVASQTQEHLELDRLQDMTLQFHLREAEGALKFANRVLPAYARKQDISRSYKS